MFPFRRRRPSSSKNRPPAMMRRKKKVREKIKLFGRGNPTFHAPSVRRIIVTDAAKTAASI